MTSIFQTPEPQADAAPEDESVQPIAIRKLDRLETTAPFGAPTGT
jgi:hypothetical protein